MSISACRSLTPNGGGGGGEWQGGLMLQTSAGGDARWEYDRKKKRHEEIIE